MIDLLMKNLNHYMELASSHSIELKDYDFIFNKYFYILGSCLRNKIEVCCLFLCLIPLDHEFIGSSIHLFSPLSVSPALFNPLRQ